jgi:hypothetical protein
MGTATDITTASRTSPEVREEQDVAWGVAVNALGVRSSSIVTGDPTDARVPPCDSMLPRYESMRRHLGIRVAPVTSGLRIRE